MIGNGNEEWCRWATKYLYEGIVNTESIDSKEWAKYGVITQFDRNLSFSLATDIPSTKLIPTNNRNWLLVTRAAVAAYNGLSVPIEGINVSVSTPPKTFTVENQSILNTFGTGQWPHVMYFPEEWSRNVPRTVTAVNNTAATPIALSLNFKFLQVRTV